MTKDFFETFWVILDQQKTPPRGSVFLCTLYIVLCTFVLCTFLCSFLKVFALKFAHVKIFLYLCTRFYQTKTIHRLLIEPLPCLNGLLTMFEACFKHPNAGDSRAIGRRFTDDSLEINGKFSLCHYSLEGKTDKLIEYLKPLIFTTKIMPSLCHRLH